MPKCNPTHARFDRYANGSIHVGELPYWTHVKGTVAYYVFKGPSTAVSGAWTDFLSKVHTQLAGKVSGPPGDVYPCDPEDHPGSDASHQITILWAPLNEK